MIRITGPDRNGVLPAFETEYYSERKGKMRISDRENTPDYCLKFLSQPAIIGDDSITLKTYHEENDAKCIRHKAEIKNLDINVEVCEQVEH